MNHILWNLASSMKLIPSQLSIRLKYLIQLRKLKLMLIRFLEVVIQRPLQTRSSNRYGAMWRKATSMIGVKEVRKYGLMIRTQNADKTLIWWLMKTLKIMLSCMKHFQNSYYLQTLHCPTILPPDVLAYISYMKLSPLAWSLSFKSLRGCWGE